MSDERFDRSVSAIQFCVFVKSRDKKIAESQAWLPACSGCSALISVSSDIYHSAWAAASIVFCLASPNFLRIRSYSSSGRSLEGAASAAAAAAAGAARGVKAVMTELDKRADRGVVLVARRNSGPWLAMEGGRLPTLRGSGKGGRGDPVPREECTREPARAEISGSTGSAGPSLASNEAGGGGKEDMPGVTEGNTVRNGLAGTSANVTTDAACDGNNVYEEFGTGTAEAVRADTTGERSVVRGDAPGAPRLLRRRAEWRTLSDPRGDANGNGSDVCACNRPDACECEACSRGDVMVSVSACKSGVDMESDNNGGDDTRRRAEGNGPGTSAGEVSATLMVAGTAGAAAECRFGRCNGNANGSANRTLGGLMPEAPETKAGTAAGDGVRRANAGTAGDATTMAAATAGGACCGAVGSPAGVHTGFRTAGVASPEDGAGAGAGGGLLGVDLAAAEDATRCKNTSKYWEMCASRCANGKLVCCVNTKSWAHTQSANTANNGSSTSSA